MKITVGIPAFNEEKNIAAIIVKLKKTADNVIVCNDGSTDATGIIAEELGAIVINHTKNQGYGASINYSVKKIKTPYFLVVQPDVIGINEKALINFYNYAKKLKDKFAVLGPHFKNASKSGHYQTNLKYKIKKIHNVHGSTIFFNKKVFIKNNGFDDNILHGNVLKRLGIESTIWMNCLHCLLTRLNCSDSIDDIHS